MRIKFSKYHGLGNDFILTRYIEGIDIPTLVQACCSEYIKLDRDKSTFKSHRDFNSEKEISFKHF